ncbi:hypothetical protein FNV43_RR02073 [Rhamnella rubrinervis]|uniref:F-box domain-containing protein n=1 Tax=Rhamnella rubrinervis TaxID=2594499 RepID=A0A8K0MTU2_9ROSA|nr:hypothetical protein FNV43_RR02073 [Rhamnella rubrinervis]
MAKRASCLASPEFSSAKWAIFHTDLLETMLDKLVLSDYIRCSAVCKSWNSIVLNHKQKRIRLSNHQLPWQLIIHLGYENGQKIFGLYDFFARTRITNFQLHIPNEYNSYDYCDSSRGWLFFKVKKSEIFIIINPLSGTIFHLPKLISRRFHGGRFILSNDPCFGSFEVLAIDNFRNKVAHLKFGDDYWSYTKRSCEIGIRLFLSSFIFYKDRIIACCNKGIVSLELINNGDGDIHSLRINVLGELSPELKKLYDHSCLYLVENTNGDLLLVVRHIVVVKYDIFKIIESKTGRFEHIPVMNLKSHSLFLGNNHSISVLASNYPGCKQNSIYCSHVLTSLARQGRFLKCVFSMDEFNLDDKIVQRIPSVEIWTEDQSVDVLGEVSWIVLSMKF